MAYTPFVKFEITFTGNRYTSGSIQITPSSLWKGSSSDVCQYSYTGYSSDWQTWDGSSAITVYSWRNMTSDQDGIDRFYGTLYFRGKLASMHAISSTDARWNIAGTGSYGDSDKIAVSGSISALFDYTVESPTVNVSSACAYMFASCSFLTSAQNLELNVMPSTSYSYFYRNMFGGCTQLLSPPVLPKTTLAPYCYYQTFYNCQKIETAPALPATTLASYCYYQMFYQCTALLTAPALPATTLVTSCYSHMFQNCTSLLIPPSLPATTLASYCYYYMFQGCTSLLIAPNLPATTLASYCYRAMFQGCTSLTIAPKIAATNIPECACMEMFYDADNLNISTSGTGPHMFYYETVSGTDAVSDMFSGTGGSSSDPVANTKYYCSEPVSIGISSYNTLVTAVAKLLYKRMYTSTTIGSSTYPGYAKQALITTNASNKRIIWKIDEVSYTPEDTISRPTEATILSELTSYLTNKGLGATQFARGTVTSSKYYIYLAQAIADFILKMVVVCYSTYYNNKSGSLKPYSGSTSPNTQDTFSTKALYFDYTPSWDTPTHVDKTAANITEEDIESILNCLILSFRNQSVTSPELKLECTSSSSSCSSSSSSSCSSSSCSCSCSSIFIAYFNI